MHEKRDFVIVLLTIVCALWALTMWFIAVPEHAAWKWVALGSLVVMAGLMVHALFIQDKLTDHLGEVVGGVYYHTDGIDFMPTVRVRDGQAELCVYYQNCFENPADVIVHLRPPEDSFQIRPGMRDVHFAFKAGGGDFGAIHQPITVPKHLLGEVINIELAAATYYPRSHGARLKRQRGLPCGTLLVDWSGAAFRTGVHEVSGEIPLDHPAHLHLSMPKESGVTATRLADVWRQERLVQGIPS